MSDPAVPDSPITRLTGEGREMVAAIMAIEDPAERAKALSEIIGVTQDVLTWFALRRREALGELRAQGASYQDVADLLGVTKGRAQQLCQGLPRSGG